MCSAIQTFDHHGDTVASKDAESFMKTAQNSDFFPNMGNMDN